MIWTTAGPFETAETHRQGVHLANARGGRMDVSLLEPWLVRVSFFPDGDARTDRTWMIGGATGNAAEMIPREGRRRDDYSVFSSPSPRTEIGNDAVTIEGEALSVRVARVDGAIRWRSADGVVYAEDLSGRSYGYNRGGYDVFHYMKRLPDERYYGFGERAGPLNKRGLRMRMHNLDALGYSAVDGDPLYKHWPVYITFDPTTHTAYGLIYDNLSDTVFDMGKEIDAYHGDYRYYHAADGDLDYYMVFGPEISDVVQRISLLIGRIERPPRWTLGYLGSGMGYTDSPDAAMRLDDFVDECRRNDIPCDMFHLSSGYSMSNEGMRYVFVWNRDRVPDPPAVARTFCEAGMRVAANIKPCLLTSHPDYNEADKTGVFLSDDSGPHIADFWGGKGSYIDFTAPAGYDWWKGRVKASILENGIDATWNDNNEYEIWDDTILCEGFGSPIPISRIRPLHALLMTRASYESQRENRPDERPFVLCRSGCPGIQRYAQTWSGDNSTGWDTLKYNVPMGLGFGLTGQPNTGHDVGGFWGDVPSPELLVRWVQNGIFHPRFSIHSWRLDGSATEPWTYPEVIGIIRDAIRFRYRLIPYLYSLYVHAVATGEPIIRPLVYHFPEDPNVADESFDFLLGEGLLVASVFTEGARERDLYLPGDVAWCDVHTGTWIRGGTRATVPAPLERSTILAKEGSIIPFGRAMDRVDGGVDDYREVWVFPGRSVETSLFEIVEDDGISFAYRHGDETVVQIRMNTTDTDIEIRAVATKSGYSLYYNTVTIVLPLGEGRPLRGPDAVVTEPDSDGRRQYTIPVQHEGYTE